MAIKFHDDLIQHTDEWRQARCGLLTASEMENIVTPAKLQIADNEKVRNHINELAAQRVNQYVEPTWFGGDLERGIVDEIEARGLYNSRYAPVKQTGFITNDKFSYTSATGEKVGFTLGYSPDGLVDTDGQIEVKSRCQKYQMETIIADEMPLDYRIQVQAGMLISERPWCDFISYCGGMPMFTKRVFADPTVQDALLAAAMVFHQVLDAKIKIYQERLKNKDSRLIPTTRKILEEMR